MSARVLVVDDEENLRLVLRTMLRKHGYEVETCASAEQALETIDASAPDFVIADVRMGGMSGIELTKELKRRGADAVVIVMSAFGSVDLAIEAMKAGAYDYVSKPFKQDEVLLALRKAEEREQLRRENQALREERAQSARFETMIGRSEAMHRVFRVVDRAAEVATTVLIQGESGTGKELVARALHDRGPRKSKAFVAVNCGAIPESLLESELFGHKRGAFTDATSDKTGLFEAAHEGTIFLDEIGELPLALQVKLLRVLQEGTLRRVGETKDRKVDVRVVAATVRDLESEVREGTFREDLFYRLNVLPLTVPPLRDRKDDVPLLVDHFVARNNTRLGTRVRGVDEAARKMLLAYHWPGNVRELENVVERAMVLAERDVIGEVDLPERVKRKEDARLVALASDELSIKKTARWMEETLIRRALEQTGGNRTAAARLLEISHRALLYKIKDYGIR
ncbi:sigma-54-dependent transcriptional regulator [Sandaracinus amylolyticus]|uniref:Type IV fimbriae expression regulatory protein PilR n=1 Tax=Sandaracinus amylolyticus TaxID=927083 RepID=A0A0F6W5V4_9BACT|nr:sigma-54 dependent transcriptional regulator [Sandaracinus amylolyticus]AKF08275.1 Type IV fimbriae expression regulatory protein PilR [Sandaracinus amylolyticus]